MNELRYTIRYPETYREGQKYPVILFLHGAGTRSSDLAVLNNNPYFTITGKHADFPFITVAPQCPAEHTWFDLFEQLKALAEKTAAEPFADRDRLYLVGASMGGYATWQLAMSLPHLFAAIVPICGGGMYWNAARLKSVPVWAFHGAKDETVLPEESEKMVEAVNRRGGTAKLTVYPENAHDAWSDTYENPAVFAWLLEHTKNTGGPGADEFSGSKNFG